MSKIYSLFMSVMYILLYYFSLEGFRWYKGRLWRKLLKGDYYFICIFYSKFLIGVDFLFLVFVLYLYIFFKIRVYFVFVF